MMQQPIVQQLPNGEQVLVHPAAPQAPQMMVARQGQMGWQIVTADDPDGRAFAIEMGKQFDDMGVELAKRMFRGEPIEPLDGEPVA